MQPLVLTLKGFRGIRDGLGREHLTLDLERLADGGALVAIAGANGRGKSTIMDNLHPYLTMPSRAAQAGPGGFSFYDQVFLPESEKDLTWAHQGRSYRSQVVIRLNGRKRTEAFLLGLGEDGAWRPVALDDGTVSDGKVETYNRCVEALCGPAETFFMSVFSAQGKRQLSAYRQGEIKTLLADLLGQAEIQVLGQKAAETARLLKAQLAVLRADQAAQAAEAQRLDGEATRLDGTAAGLGAAARARVAAAAALEQAQRAHARELARQEQAQATEVRRQQLLQEQGAAEQSLARAMAALRVQDEAEQLRWNRLQAGLGQRLQRRAQRLGELQRQRGVQARVLETAPQVRRAQAQLARAQAVAEGRDRALVGHRAAVQAFHAARQGLGAAEQQKVALEREAGQAVLQAEGLSRRLGLIRRVPCDGSPLQEACPLLADTREARSLLPSAQHQVQRLGTLRAALDHDIDRMRHRVQALSGATEALQRGEQRAERARQRVLCLAALAARAGEVAHAEAALATIDAELAGMVAADGPSAASETPDEATEREQIGRSRARIAAERQALVSGSTLAKAKLGEALAALPALWDGRELAVAAARVQAAQAGVADAEQAHLVAIRAAEGRAALESQRRATTARQEDQTRRLATVSDELANWLLFARCMGNDGLIALAIDDAGPTLSGLVNDLLLACYGPRFTVSITTLQETAKGEQREGFDILVHDAETGQSKSVTAMSGGERVWVNECLVRAVALYQAQNTGRHQQTLFSDETDGPLDPDHKRMFMAMKREVLRIGGYEREFFVSQTPELTAMADAVIDLDRWAAEVRG